jgi:dCTP deaminase
MTVLSDASIWWRVKHGLIGIDPFIEENVQPASIDFTLSNHFWFFKESFKPLDPKEDARPDMQEVYADPFFVLRSFGFAIGSTVERVKLPDNIVGRLEGKSSLARLGLAVHSTAGFFDPGFEGSCTLEFFNMTHRDILLHPGMRVCQMSFMRMDGPASRPYGTESLGSKYQGQQGATTSRMHENFQ